jgi:hypothetical protein
VAASIPNTTITKQADVSYLDSTTATEKKRIVEGLKRDLPRIIRNTPHSCQTEEHCCALHAAHKAAAQKVEEHLDKVLKQIDDGKA